VTTISQFSLVEITSGVAIFCSCWYIIYPKTIKMTIAVI